MNELSYITDGQQPDPQMTAGRRPEHGNSSSEQSKDIVELAAELIAGKPNEPTDVDTEAVQDEPEREPGGSDAGETFEEAQQEAGEESPAESEQGDSTEEVNVRTAKELAEKLGVDPKDLYKVEFNLRGGSTATLGQMKDAAEKLETVDQEYAVREKQLNDLEIELHNARQQVSMYQQEIAEQLTPERRAEIQSAQEATLAQEGASLRAAVPELAEQAKFDQFREDTVKYLGRWGFKPHELQITDHRVLLVVKHGMDLERRLENLAKMKPKQPPVRTRKQTAPKPTEKPQQRPMEIGIDDQVRAVAKLIGK